MARQGKWRLSTKNNVKSFWDDEASEIGHTPQVTIRDLYFRIHELHTLLPIIPTSSRLLDIGCGTGFGTIAFSKRVDYTLGLDYSKNMISWANKTLNDKIYRETLSKDFSPVWELPFIDKTKIEFIVEDVTKMELKVPKFDVIIAQRILVNMTSHKDQIKVIRNLRKHCVANGQLIICEATLQGHKKTDNYRSLFDLPPLEKHWHNEYLDEDKLNTWEDEGWQIQYVTSYDTYMLISRVIYPASCGEVKFLSDVNRSAMEIASLFRTKNSVDEIGIENFFQLYLNRLKRYDNNAACKIEKWINKNITRLIDWNNLGHHRLIVARRV
jgi:ubiquinone/menaquinone biosynthesis C-methylase UbiE